MRDFHLLTFSQNHMIAAIDALAVSIAANRDSIGEREVNYAARAIVALNDAFALVRAIGASAGDSEKPIPTLSERMDEERRAVYENDARNAIFVSTWGSREPRGGKGVPLPVPELAAAD